MARRAPLPASLACAMALAAGGCTEEAPADAVSVPSGRDIRFLDVITDAPGPEGVTARFRFVAPDLAAGQDWSADMLALCESYALPRTEGMVAPPRQIIIALAGRALPFGEAAPEAVQFFEAYRIENASCIWEMF